MNFLKLVKVIEKMNNTKINILRKLIETIIILITEINIKIVENLKVRVNMISKKKIFKKEVL
jgi:hypothetical protein